MNIEEKQYIDLLSKVMSKGEMKNNRTGVPTKSIFGAQMRFSLKEHFPLFTTKKMFWKGIVEELLWMIRGETNSKLLEEKGVNIWKGNTSREFLDKRGLNYPEGEIGPLYGFQWRNYGGTYECIDWIKATEEQVSKGANEYLCFNPIRDAGKAIEKQMHKSLTGVDQLKNVIEKIKTDPNDRRLIIDVWNVKQNDKAVLCPCTAFLQFYVNNGKLSLQTFCRSSDFFLGCPHNASQYALLCILIARITDLEPHELVWTGGDVHIYQNHFDAVNEQLNREPFDFPKLKINKDIKTLEDIENMKFEDFELVDYKCYPAIKAPMAI